MSSIDALDAKIDLVLKRLDRIDSRLSEVAKVAYDSAVKINMHLEDHEKQQSEGKVTFALASFVGAALLKAMELLAMVFKK